MITHGPLARLPHFLFLLSLTACAASAAAGPDSALSPPNAPQLIEIAAILEQRGETVRAQQYLRQALRAGADPAEVTPRLLRLYVADGQYRLAAEQAEHHLRRNPRDDEVRLLLATLQSALGQHVQAVAQYERVIAHAPGDAQAHFALASALHDNGQLARADEHYRAYLALEPRGAYAEEARSLLLTELP